MQSTCELLSALSLQGISITLVGDKLKVEPKRLISDEVKSQIGRHRAEIVSALSGGPAKDSTYAKKGDVQIDSEPNSPLLEHSRHVSPVPKNRGCFQCGHFDGKGDTWPGTCRYFETIGEPAKEIDFNVVDPLHGCKCFTPESDTKRLQVIQGHDERRLPPGDDPGWFTPGQDGEPAQRVRTGQRPSPVAITWLRENKAALKTTGWPASQLWRRNKARGICWSSRWEAPFFKAYLYDDGVIEFECVIAGRDVIQTTRPMPQRNTQRNAN